MSEPFEDHFRRLKQLPVPKALAQLLLAQEHHETFLTFKDHPYLAGMPESFRALYAEHGAQGQAEYQRAIELFSQLKLDRPEEFKYCEQVMHLHRARRCMIRLMKDGAVRARDEVYRKMLGEFELWHQRLHDEADKLYRALEREEPAYRADRAARAKPAAPQPLAPRARAKPSAHEPVPARAKRRTARSLTPPRRALVEEVRELEPDDEAEEIFDELESDSSDEGSEESEDEMR